MKIKLGLLGASDAVSLIEKALSEYSEFKCIPIVYEKKSDICRLLLQHDAAVDVWLFSGLISYSIAKECEGIHHPMFYIDYHGATLYKTLFHIVYTHQYTISQLSFDYYHPSVLLQALEEAGIKEDNLTIHSYTGFAKKDAQEDDWVNYHLALWQAGITKAAVTTVQRTETRLKQLGVPVFRVLPSVLTIKSILNRILQACAMQKSMDNQIAVQIIELDPLHTATDSHFSIDQLYKQEYKTAEKLLRYSQKVQGSFKPLGSGRFVIFTSRGMLRELTKNFTIIPQLKELTDLSEHKLSCGIGIGTSPLQAEANAAKALLSAREYGEGNWLAIFDDKTVVGPLGRFEHLTYSYFSEELLPISSKTSLSVSTLGKLLAVLKKIGRTQLSAYELADFLQIQPRSARRILNELEKTGFAQVIGEENLHSKGRSRKVYRILFE